MSLVGKFTSGTLHRCCLNATYSLVQSIGIYMNMLPVVGQPKAILKISLSITLIVSHKQSLFCNCSHSTLLLPARTRMYGASVPASILKIWLSIYNYVIKTISTVISVSVLFDPVIIEFFVKYLLYLVPYTCAMLKLDCIMCRSALIVCSQKKLHWQLW